MLLPDFQSIYPAMKTCPRAKDANGDCQSRMILRKMIPRARRAPQMAAVGPDKNAGEDQKQPGAGRAQKLFNRFQERCWILVRSEKQ
jgi:hypothetical protein